MDDSKLIKLILVIGMCFCVGNGLISNNNFVSLSDSEGFLPQSDVKSYSRKFHTVENNYNSKEIQEGSPFNTEPCNSEVDSFQDDCTTNSESNVGSLPSELMATGEEDEGTGEPLLKGDEISGEEVEPGEYQNTPGGDLSRHKRYPEHLDPTKNAFFPFWLRVGGETKNFSAA